MRVISIWQDHGHSILTHASGECVKHFFRRQCKTAEAKLCASTQEYRSGVVLIQTRSYRTSQINYKTKEILLMEIYNLRAL
jgi:hypothetical protein